MKIATPKEILLKIGDENNAAIEKINNRYPIS